MLKLYKSNYTRDELLATAEHCSLSVTFRHTSNCRNVRIIVRITEFVVIFAVSVTSVCRKLITGNTAIVKYLT